MSTLALLLIISTKPPDMSYDSEVCLSFSTFIFPLPRAAIIAACLSSISKVPSVPGSNMPYTSPLNTLCSGVNISSVIKPQPLKGLILSSYEFVTNLGLLTILLVLSPQSPNKGSPPLGAEGFNSWLVPSASCPWPWRLLCYQRG
jgi:hypothetical protein